MFILTTTKSWTWILRLSTQPSNIPSRRVRVIFVWFLRPYSAQVQVSVKYQIKVHQREQTEVIFLFVVCTCHTCCHPLYCFINSARFDQFFFSHDSLISVQFEIWCVFASDWVPAAIPHWIKRHRVSWFLEIELNFDF